jgi:peptidoglycan/LPS O-acetylase OafA/YrhL
MHPSPQVISLRALDSALMRFTSPREQLLANLHRRNIPGLDAIRGIAALSVVAFHGWSEHFPGTLAVQVFFVISGLLITWLLLQEQERYGTINRKAFYCRRAFRLFPALFTLLAWEWLVGIPHVHRSAILASALYFANYRLILRDDLGNLGHTWSLAVEEHFYLIWPLIFVSVRNRLKLMGGCFVVALGSFGWRLFAAIHFGKAYAYAATETNLVAILLGCGIALLLRERPTLLPEFALRPYMAVVSIIVICALAQVPAQPQVAWAVPSAAPFAAILVLQAIAYDWRILRTRVMRFLGRISYGIYLWGFVAIALCHRLGHEFKHTLVFAFAIAAASISHYAIERPVQSFGRRLLASTKDNALSTWFTLPRKNEVVKSI